MKKFKLYQFALALAAGVLLSAAASELNRAYAAPAASVQNFQGALPEQATQVQRRYRRNYYRRDNRWVGPAIALGIFGAAAAAAAAQNQQYYYYEQPRQRCWVQTGPYQGQGYWAWC